MTHYMLFMNDKLEITASVTDDMSKLFICTYEGDTAGLLSALDMAKQIVDATLVQLDFNRRMLELDKVMNKEMN